MSDNIASAAAVEEEASVPKKRRRSRKQKQVIEPSLNMSELRKLASLVIEHGFTDFEFENENIRVRLSKSSAAAIQSGQAPSYAPVVSHAAPTFAAEPVAAAAIVDEDAGLHKITSPIVGTFYRSPGPDKEAYVSEGTKVTADTTVCIVEAMKLMNEIQAEVSGEVVKIYVENGQPVEFGQPLFGIRM
jgi:acetyl-CoA carboxylase biotin carboxyl carrier protein